MNKALTKAIDEYITRHYKGSPYEYSIYEDVDYYAEKFVVSRNGWCIAEHSIGQNRALPAKALHEKGFVERITACLIKGEDLEPMQAVRQACDLCFPGYFVENLQVLHAQLESKLLHSSAELDKA